MSRPCCKSNDMQINRGHLGYSSMILCLGALWRLPEIIKNGRRGFSSELSPLPVLLCLPKLKNGHAACSLTTSGEWICYVLARQSCCVSAPCVLIPLKDICCGKCLNPRVSHSPLTLPKQLAGKNQTKNIWSPSHE